MEKLRQISKKNNWLILPLGVILAAFVLIPSNTDSIVETDQSEQSDDKSATVSELNFEAVPATAQVPVERNSYLIETLPTNEEPESFQLPVSVFLSSPAKVFKVLFRHIISPNSP